MNFVYWFLDSPTLHFIIVLLIIVVIVSIKDIYKGCFSLALLILPCFYIFSFWFPDYPKEILSEEHYIEFRVYQEEQKQEKIRQKQEERMKQQQIELEIQKRLEEKWIKHKDHRTPR